MISLDGLIQRCGFAKLQKVFFNKICECKECEISYQWDVSLITPCSNCNLYPSDEKISAFKSLLEEKLSSPVNVKFLPHDKSKSVVFNIPDGFKEKESQDKTLCECPACGSSMIDFFETLPYGVDEGDEIFGCLECRVGVSQHEPRARETYRFSAKEIKNKWNYFCLRSKINGVK